MSVFFFYIQKIWKKLKIIIMFQPHALILEYQKMEVESAITFFLNIPWSLYAIEVLNWREMKPSHVPMGSGKEPNPNAKV